MFGLIPGVGRPAGAVQAGQIAPAIDPGILPVGFDAVVQAAQAVLQQSLAGNLAAVGADTLSATVPYAGTTFPPALAAAIAPLIRPGETSRSNEAIYVELVFSDPQLLSLSAGYEPPPGSVVVPVGPAVAEVAIAPVLPASPYQISWQVQLNLLRTYTPVVIYAATATVSTGATTGATENAGAGSAGGGPAGPPSGATETRVLLATGTAVLQLAASTATNPALLEAWVELDSAGAQMSISTTSDPLHQLLGAPLGQQLVRSALLPLITQGSLRASPLFALGGVMSAAQVATVGLGVMNVVHAVQLLPDGRWLLSLGFTFGPDRHGSAAQLQPFVGSKDFAFFCSLELLAAVAGERWRINGTAREFVDTIPVQMPQNSSSDTIGVGTARVQIAFTDTLTSVIIVPFSSEAGDVVQLTCDGTVQILALWYADGSEVSDLGSLGNPETMPFVVNNAPFDVPPAAETSTAQFRALLRYVLEPLVLPFVDTFDVYAIDGYSSAALGAVIGSWSLAIPFKGHGEAGQTTGATENA